MGLTDGWRRQTPVLSGSKGVSWQVWVWVPVAFCFVLFFETRSFSLAQASLKLVILLLCLPRAGVTVCATTPGSPGALWAVNCKQGPLSYLMPLSESVLMPGSPCYVRLVGISLPSSASCPLQTLLSITTFCLFVFWDSIQGRQIYQAIN
jgi:hypothetical protein